MDTQNSGIIIWSSLESATGKIKNHGAWKFGEGGDKKKDFSGIFPSDFIVL